jgi:preprotein translocase subunit SecG
MSTFLIVALVVLSFIVIVSVLLQPAKGGNSAFGGGGNAQSLFGGSGSTSFLFKVSLYGGFTIMAICLLLAVIHVRESKKSVIDGAPLSAPVETAPAAPVTSAPEAPAQK